LADEYGQNSVFPNPHGLLSITSDITSSQRRWKQTNFACGKIFRKVPAELVPLIVVSHHRGVPESAMRAPAATLRARAIDVTRARIEDLASADSCSRPSMYCQVDATDSHIGSRPVRVVQESEEELVRKSPRSSTPE
jgi:hypothetical protein